MAMADLTFDLQYDGPALQAHEMNVRDLAPALVATAELFQEVNRVLRPMDPDVSVNIRATDAGSFKINLTLVYLVALQTLTSPEAVAATNLLQLLESTGRLIEFIKKKTRFGVKDQEPSDPPGDVTVTFGEDGGTVQFPKSVLDLEQNFRVRRELSEIVKPLSKEGVDVVRLRRELVTVGEIVKPDLPAFSLPTVEPSDDILAIKDDEIWLTIRTIDFKRGNKWRLSDGQSTFWVEILDEGFWDQVEADRPFAVHDRLLCRIRRVQRRDEQVGLKSETQVLQVVHHEPRTEKQGNLLGDTQEDQP